MTRPAFPARTTPTGAAQPERRRWLIRHVLLALGGWSSAGPTGAGTPESRVAPIPIELAGDLSPDLLATVDLSRHLVSEKLDGVRALWTGTRWLTRSGRPIAAPAHWLAALPAGVALDGELWLGRGRFEALSGLLHRADAPADPLWSSVRYAIFDLPGAPGSFLQRQLRLRAILAGLHSGGAAVHIDAVEQRRVADADTLQRWLDEVVSQGGEGLMLHAADADFRPGRSNGHLLKLKPLSDAEAVVIAHLPGKGRHAGRLGALQVRDDSGRRFAIGSGLSDAQRDSPPAIGQRISYRHRGLTRTGRPRFATFWRVVVGDGV
ncbi:DNA ligase [Sphaerotilus mobilis]|uniref:DNA ligase-1 n=1 Tax=Sphaerotilus mobilis TaxID=47994 RepID=A0A4Q7LQR7_9BURK|nr:DNA ligase [Sphaerotilus mobilis]RZS57245.1 DNA ligase-1 [Sphaerotilus mobilis]